VVHKLVAGTQRVHDHDLKVRSILDAPIGPDFPEPSASTTGTALTTCRSDDVRT